MIVNIDIETIPGQGLFEGFLEEVKNNFKAPSSLSKKQALEDMGLHPEAQPQKYWTKDDTIRQWEKVMSSTKAHEVAEENWRKTSFDGAKGEIISICCAINEEPVMAFSRNVEVSGDSVLISSEAEMLETFFWDVSAQLNARKPYFVGHNIGSFDLKFIFQRSVINKILPTFKIPFAGRHSSDYFDTMIAWAGYKDTIKQDALCKALGIEGKPGDIDGSKVWDFVKSGDVERVVEYNIDDVQKNREIYRRLNFIDRITID